LKSDFGIREILSKLQPDKCADGDLREGLWSQGCEEG
jgi:hypothetical protein